jgi:glyoxylase-like metal-dependent hydrolase (beta-lactamase superfamily II)
LIDTGNDEFILIDTGDKMFGTKMIKTLYRSGLNPEKIKHILLTHCHQDHAGNVARLKKISNALVYAHSEGVETIQNGEYIPDLTPYPGFINWLMHSIFIGYRPAYYEPSEVDYKIKGGDVLSINERIDVIYAPGHSSDHIIYFWPQNGGVLFLGDIANNVNRLGYHVMYNNLKQAENYLSNIAKMDFNSACFGHGKPIIGNASKLFKLKWGSS